MISKEIKLSTVKTLEEALANAGSVFLVDFAKIKVADDTQLRKTLSQQGIFYRVAKNTLIKRALHTAGITALDAHLEKPTAILVGSIDDPIAPARAIIEFQKLRKDLLTSKVSYLDGETLQGSTIGDIAKMPGKRELQASVIQLFMSPGATLVGLIKGPGSKIAGQVEAFIKRFDVEVDASVSADENA
jgi:large subunit ribosomal protein L10